MKKVKLIYIVIVIAVSSVYAAGQERPLCFCPRIFITEPLHPVTAGETLTFSADFSGNESENATFIWIADRGSIISGQGTSQIEIDTAGLEDMTVTVTVSLDNQCTCEFPAVGTGVVLPSPIPQPVRLFYRFNEPPCDEFLSVIDALLIELINNPDLSAHIISYGTSAARRRVDFRMKSYIRTKDHFDSGRFAFSSGGSGGERAYIEFWLVPTGDATFTIPLRNDIKIEPEPPEPTEPYVVTGEYYDPIGGCSLFDPDYFAGLLKNNPQSRGNIVIFETSRRRFREKKKQIVDRLTDSGVSRRRLKTFYVQVENGETERRVELWYLP